MKTLFRSLLTLFAVVSSLLTEVRAEPPQLEILSATYGVGARRTEVTDSVRSLLVHGVVLLRSPWELGREDPAVNEIKDVEIVYRLDGARQTATFTQEHDIVLQPNPNGLTIVSARFGIAERRIDVTDALRAQISDEGILQLDAGWFLGSVDPAFGTVKDVEIVYLDHGTPGTVTVAETQDILLPAKAVTKVKAPDAITSHIRGWGKSIDPDGDCKFSLKEDELSICVPGSNGPHDLAAEIEVTNAPRVLQSVRGDFMVQAKIEGRFEPGDQSTLPGRTGYNGAGLVVMADANNVICLARAALQREDSDPTHYANFEIRVNGELKRMGLTGDYPLPATGPVHVRIERRGQTILGAVSEDGKRWHELTPKELPSTWPDQLQTGVVAISTSKEEFTPRFSHFEISVPTAVP